MSTREPLARHGAFLSRLRGFFVHRPGGGLFAAPGFIDSIRDWWIDRKIHSLKWDLEKAYHESRLHDVGEIFVAMQRLERKRSQRFRERRERDRLERAIRTL